MDKNAIKKYAIWARRELIARVSQKAEQYGITEQEIIDENAETVHGVVLSPVRLRQRRALIDLIRRDGYRQAMEEVAYTWFNRFIALRFMEVNDYLPGHIRAFTDEENAFKPKLLTDALNLELNGLDLDKVIRYKEENKQEALYQYLLITLCNHLSEILPGMFQRIDDYTELLFPEHLLREGSVLEKLVSEIPAEDWLDAVQIIGWLYQYYNTELNELVYDGTFSKTKITKDLLPAATTIYTPDWPIRYMVENSLGRLWVEGHPSAKEKYLPKHNADQSVCVENGRWNYYLEEAKQEPEVEEQLKVIRSEYAKMKPEDIRCIDPCAGSGHILVYLFDVLIQIYEDYGYPTRDAVESIVRNNLWGLDIDDRAAQLSYFAVMMKARKYDKGWFRRGIEPNVFALQDSPFVENEFYSYFGDMADAARRVMDAFHDAKEYGSIIQPNVTVEELDRLDEIMQELLEKIQSGDLAYMVQAKVIDDTMKILLRQTRALVQKYDVVVTNPPYLGSTRFGSKLDAFVKSNYPDEKSDLSMIMLRQALDSFAKKAGFVAFITTSSWMFLSSFVKTRTFLFDHASISSIVDFGTELFEGKVGHNPIVAWVTRNIKINYTMTAIRLVDYCYSRRDEKETEFFNYKNCYNALQERFISIPGMPVAYWVSEHFINSFRNGSLLGSLADSKQGIATADNNHYLRMWYEIDNTTFKIDCSSHEEAKTSREKWYPYNKGGEFRKWYGNNDFVVNWSNDGNELRHDKKAVLRNPTFYFRECFSWSLISSSVAAFRYKPKGHLFDVAGMSCFSIDHLNYLLALCNSCVAMSILRVLAPTINYQCGDIANIPVIIQHEEVVNEYVKDNIDISRADWDKFETSWDFKVHPFVEYSRGLWDVTRTQANMSYFYGDIPQISCPVEICWQLWQDECDERFRKLKANEEELNRLFIDIYGLQDELTPEVEEKDVTVRKADLGRDIRSLVSYAVGCMLGRYSLDKPGLAYAGGDWDASQYATYPADHDGILPITDDEYFADDIVSMFVDWVKTVYGAETLEENLKFIASALYPSGGGSARDLIRQYFLNDFYKDHVKIYQKRPIYWLFDSGKKNGFKCLIYLHRYRPDTIARIRTDYVHEMQGRYHTAIDDLAHRVESAGGSERVRLQKQLSKIQEQENELRKYEEKIHHYADMMLPLDLDDGVKVNYAKLADVLAPIK